MDINLPPLQSDNDLEQSLLDELQLGIITFDSQGMLLQMNKKSGNMLKYMSPESIILSREDLEKELGVTFKKNIEEVENYIIRKNGYTLSATSHLFGENDEQTHLVQLQNISGHMKQLSTTHRQTSDILWKLRSKITPIENAFEIFAGGIDEIEPKLFNELLTSSRFELWQIERFLDNYMDLSLYNANDLSNSLIIEKIDIKKCVREAVYRINTFLSNFNVNYSIINNIEQSCQVSGDFQRLTRIIESIMINAVVYNNKMSIVQINHDHTDNECIITIEDNGLGIKDAEQKNVFSYGFRGETASISPYNGMGCELFLARHILLAMKGKIEFQSKENVGSQFMLTLKKHFQSA